MRTTGLLLLPFFYLLFFSPSHAMAQKIVRGNGYILTRQCETPPFHTIEVSDSISVAVVQGEFQPLTIEADDNLFAYIKTEVSGGVLKIFISPDVFIKKFAVMNVLVTMPGITALRAMGSSQIDGTRFFWKTDNIGLYAGNNSKINLHLNARQTTVNVVSGSSVELKGETRGLSADIEAGSNLKARDLQAVTAVVKVGKACLAEIKVSGELKYNLAAGSVLTYKGNPDILSAVAAKKSRITHEK